MHKLPLWSPHSVWGNVLAMHRHGIVRCSPLYRQGSWDSMLSPSPKMMHEQGWIQDSKPGLCDSRACAREGKCKKAYFPPGPVLRTVTCLISLPYDDPVGQRSLSPSHSWGHWDSERPSGFPGSLSCQARLKPGQCSPLYPAAHCPLPKSHCFVCILVSCNYHHKLHNNCNDHSVKSPTAKTGGDKPLIKWSPRLWRALTFWLRIFHLPNLSDLHNTAQAHFLGLWLGVKGPALFHALLSPS